MSDTHRLSVTLRGRLVRLCEAFAPELLQILHSPHTPHTPSIYACRASRGAFGPSGVEHVAILRHPSHCLIFTPCVLLTTAHMLLSASINSARSTERRQWYPTLRCRPRRRRMVATLYSKRHRRSCVARCFCQPGTCPRGTAATSVQHVGEGCRLTRLVHSSPVGTPQKARPSDSKTDGGSSADARATQQVLRPANSCLELSDDVKGRIEASEACFEHCTTYSAKGSTLLYPFSQAYR